MAQDNKLATWDAWGNQYWPADYLVDARGQVRGAHFGEGDYDRTEMDIRALLKEAGHPNPGAMADPKGAVHPTRLATPETYLGLARAERFDPPPLRGTHTYAQAPKLATSHFALSGTWDEDEVAATARADAAIHAAILGKDAYLVLSPPPGGAGASGSCSTATRSRTIAPAPTSTTAWCASIASGCTTWSRRPPASTTCSAARRVRNPGLRLHLRIVPARCSRRAAPPPAPREGSERVGRLGPRDAGRLAVAQRHPAGRARGAAVWWGRLSVPDQGGGHPRRGARVADARLQARQAARRRPARPPRQRLDGGPDGALRRAQRQAPTKQRTWVSLQGRRRPLPERRRPCPAARGARRRAGPATTGRARSTSPPSPSAPRTPTRASPETGFDAAGLVQYAYAQAGVALPRVPTTSAGRAPVALGRPAPRRRRVLRRRHRLPRPRRPLRGDETVSTPWHRALVASALSSHYATSRSVGCARRASKRRRRSALATTERLETTIARLAMTGLSRPIAASGIGRDVVAEGPRQVLPDRPQRRAAQADGVRGGPQVARDEREVGGLDRDVGARADAQARGRPAPGRGRR